MTRQVHFPEHRHQNEYYYDNEEEEPEPTQVMNIPKGPSIVPKIRTIDDDAEHAGIEDIFHETQKTAPVKMKLDPYKNHHFFSDQVHFKRPQWKPEIGWWLSASTLIAFMVDMSNITSFPSNVATHGGFAFIFAYFCVVVFFVYPLLLLELLVGQYFQTGMIGIWGLYPIGRGVGMSLFYTNFLILCFLPSNILWTARYAIDAVASFKTDTPEWGRCDNDWNTCKCEGKGIKDVKCIALKRERIANGTEDDVGVSPALEYYIGKLLQMWKTKYTDPHLINNKTQNGNWETAFGFNNVAEGLGPLILFSSCIMFAIFLAMWVFYILQLKYLGQFCAFTTSLSVLALMLLSARGLSLEGSIDGLMQYFRTDLRKLLDLNMWYDAFKSAFYSTGCGLGCLITQASFNPLQHDCRRDAIVCLIVDTSTSLLGCLVGFMFVGHLYTSKNLPIPDQFPADNFAFVGLPEAFSSMSGATFFSIIFYISLFFMCLDTPIVTMYALSFSIYEEYKRKFPRQKVSKLHFVFMLLGFCLSINLICTKHDSWWILAFLRSYSFGQTAFIIMFLESVLFTWIFGIEELSTIYEHVLGQRPSIFLRVCWKFLLPMLILVILVSSYAKQKLEPVSVFGYTGPVIALNIGRVTQYFGVAIICLYVVYVYCRTRQKDRSCLQVLMLLISPEYEHKKILTDVKNAKRLYSRHYLFMLFDDEKNIHEMKDCFKDKKRTSGNEKNVLKPKQTKRGGTKTQVIEETDPNDHLLHGGATKKANKEHHNDDNAWERWDKVMAEKAETEQHKHKLFVEEEKVKNEHGRNDEMRHNLFSKDAAKVGPILSNESINSEGSDEISPALHTVPPKVLHRRHKIHKGVKGNKIKPAERMH